MVDAEVHTPATNGGGEHKSENREEVAAVDVEGDAAMDEEILKRAEEERIAKEKKAEENRIAQEEKEAAERALMSETLYIQVSAASSRHLHSTLELIPSSLVPFSILNRT